MEKIFALGLKASRVLAMSIFLFSFDSVSFSFFCDDFVCVLAGIVQLICWSGRVRLSFFFIQFLKLYFRTCPAMFYFAELFFRITHFAAFSTFCVKSF